MSLFGSLLGDIDDDLGNQMNAVNMHMRSMNRIMNTFMPDPFNMLMPFDNGFQQNAIMDRGNAFGGMNGLFGFPAMPQMNRLLNADIGGGGGSGASFCSSSVISMSSGPDGRPQVYHATSSTKTGPGGVCETRKTIQDSTTGVKKMAIGHHIGERSHIIEKEQNLRSGQLEERQEFINLDEEEAEQFDREFVGKVGNNLGGIHHRPNNRPREAISIEEIDDSDDEAQVEQFQRSSRRQLPALPAPQQNHSVHPHPYNASAARRNYRSKHAKQHQQPHKIQIEEINSTPLTAATATGSSGATTSSKIQKSINGENLQN